MSLPKRKIISEQQIGSSSKNKKLKSENHSKHLFSVDEVQSRKEKPSSHKDKHSNAHSLKKNKDSSNKSKLNDLSFGKQKLPRDSKKAKYKESRKNEKCRQRKLKFNSSEKFTSSEVTFEDCLGFNDIVMSKKKKSQLASKRTTSTVNKKMRGFDTEVENEALQCTNQSSKERVPKSRLSLSRKVADFVSAYSDIHLSCRTSSEKSSQKKGVLTNEDADRFMSSKREKTAVYSGRRNCSEGIPSLYECCIKRLIEDIDGIGYMGEVPYSLLKPLLERCTPIQLLDVERYNPNLLEDTDELWEVHCRRDYKSLLPKANETWRELYCRARDEREKKLKSVTANISASMSKCKTARQLKLAFVDSVAKPPRDVARRQAKNGTAVTEFAACTLKSKPPPDATCSAIKKIDSDSAVKSKVSAKKISVPSVSTFSSSEVSPKSTVVSSKTTEVNPKSSEVNPRNTGVPPKKPKVAPLMAKSLKFMKQCFRR